MRFKLSSSEHYVTKKEASMLAIYGFKFERSEYAPDSYWISNNSGELDIDVSTLGELQRIGDIVGSKLIIDFKENTIEIYNGYRE